ncbi:MAG: AmmeMemoRadiSam system protein B [Acidobacteriia bacterium]|nr:AmmeMemoRadiSam system protein B [Terriglobia bacterium]
MVEIGALLSVLAAAFGFKGTGGTGRPLGPAVAGTWYPGSPEALAREVDALLDRAPAPPEEDIGVVVALIEPHAGYAYSGETAAHGFRRLKGARYERVLLLGPSHYARFRGAALPDADALRTPLGDVPIDRETVRALEGRPGFMVSTAAFEREHCLEAEVPFLQRALQPGWRAVPVLLGSGTVGEEAARVADGLRPFLGAGTLTVVSSDFTHFGSGFGYVPFRDEVPERLRDLDLGAARLIEALDVEGLESYLDRTGATVCGRDAIGVLLRLLPRDSKASLLAYDTSGRMTGDFGHSVSYATMAFRSAGPVPGAHAGEVDRAKLSDAEKTTLLGLARASVRDAVLKDGSLERALKGADLTSALEAIRGAFVTLEEPAGAPRERLHLRGCIGTIVPHEPLYRSVIHNAVEAALRDPRFPPVGPGELDRLAVSISALTPIFPVAGPEAIVIGRDGVVLERGPNRAVFLPQVAPEQGWGVRELLEHLALKAGLPRDGWKDGTLSVFQAEVFGKP